MKTSRKNKYIINIAFNPIENNFRNYELDSSYVGSRNFKDKIKITPTSIEIIANRSTIVNLEDILYNHTSSMYIQILKSIIFFYLNSKIYTDINQIMIKRYRNDKLLKEINISTKDLAQISSKNFTALNQKLNLSKLEKLFDDDEKGEAILIASSYILKASTLNDEIEKFERFWKAFNKLYKYIGNNQNEHACQRELREFILKNKDKFPLSIKEISSLNSNQLRKKLRWRTLILNDHSTIKQTKAFSKFVIRYSDYRIMNVLKETLVYREDFLKNEKLYDETLNHINSKIEEKIISDAEIVTLLCIKYMYFVRNKLMHGEKIDSTLRLLPNKEIEELNWLNSILEALIIDLINCNDSY
jgi:hypothetical protein